MKSAKEYRSEAWSALSGKWGMAIVVCLVAGVIMAAVSSTGLGALILNGAITVGLCVVFTELFRSKEMKIENLFKGFTGNFVSTIIMNLLTAIFVFLWSLLFVIPGIVKAFSYSMAPYILADHPEMSGSDAITASKKLMNGKKWKLFCLNLSFIGWYLLCVVTFGIATLFVMPYVNAATAAFYESIKDEVEA